MLSMKKVTLILILHNRHYNMDRLLKYYNNFESRIILADSSQVQYKYSCSKDFFSHIYTPGFSFTKKIENALSLVETPYVVMCADDDFIIAESIKECAEFLDNHPDFAVAQGFAIQYKKIKPLDENVEFGSLYKDLNYSKETEEPIERLNNFFKHYRSLLYAVHRTEVLRTAYKDSGDIVTNLYLNEYLSGLLPIFSGKYKELPILYQVREFAPDSDDKITPNLDRIFSDQFFAKEKEQFVDLAVNNISGRYPQYKSIIRQCINNLLLEFSRSPLIGENERKTSLKKKLGKIIGRLPLFGPYLIHHNRKFEKEQDLKKIYLMKYAVLELEKIRRLLMDYAH